MASLTDRSRLDRRDFLRQGAAALGLAGLPLRAPARRVAASKALIQRYKPLGRTGLEISDISFGTSRLRGDPSLVHDAFDRGINYFDTAEGYAGGRSEETLGQALAGRREQVILASKVKCRVDTRRDELMRSLEQSLKRLRTDRVEIYFNHAVNDIERLRNDEWYEFTEQAKKQGKIRFTGMSGHGGQLIPCLDHALDGGLVDVILIAYNFGQDPAFYARLLASMDFIALQPDLPRVLAKAHQKGVGVVTMKTLMGAKLNDMRPYEHGDATFAQAAFRWVLSNPNVDALIVSMKSPEMIAEYVAASGAAGTDAADRRLLDRYAHKFGAGYCRHGCNACAASCPAGVPIAEVLRTRMYATHYRDHALAREDYARLDGDASACAGCSGAPCAGACPIGLEIASLTRSAHDMLGSG